MLAYEKLWDYACKKISFRPKLISLRFEGWFKLCLNHGGYHDRVNADGAELNWGKTERLNIFNCDWIGR